MLTFLSWYLILTLVGLAAAPLAARLLRPLPARGLLLVRPLGLLLFGYLFWLLWSVGLLPNDAGGAWIALALTAALALAAWRWGSRAPLPRLTRDEIGALIVGELLFLVAFAGWAIVRAHDPAASHTEQPMDLMFMSSLWASPSWPPQDAWLSGYPIAYYYFGYWLLVAAGRLAGTPPEITFTVGQAAWFGMLAAGSFGLTWMLLRLPRAGRTLGRAAALLGGLLGALAVAAAGNIQWMLEWLHAQGVDIARVAAWAQVRNFPAGVAQSRVWYIGTDWWWWRTSRVLADAGSSGGHQEVITEFPAFSYVLGDNHPHVLGMPIVLVVLVLALCWFWRNVDARAEERALPWPLLALSTLAVGSLLFLNTWDFPAYWLLLALAIFGGARGAWLARAKTAAIAAGVMLGGSLLLMLPYLLTAQSQANGFALNFFNPTRPGQFLWVTLPALLDVVALILLAWRERAPHLGALLGLLIVTTLLPLGALTGVFALVRDSTEFVNRNPLPEGVTTTLTAIALGRWRTGVWTLLLVGTLLALVSALWLRQNQARTGDDAPSATPFVLLMAAAGVALLWAPEILYLRDNFGWRMNTIFKFYYQSWLLLGIGGAWSITHALASLRRRAGAQPWAALAAAPALLLLLAGVFFLPAGARAKTGGFAHDATFDASAWMAGTDGRREAAFWLRANAPRNATLAEAIGLSYRSDLSRVSTLSGRPTLLGWQGHEQQWRGDAYTAMAAGRTEALEQIYRTARAEQIPAILGQWAIDYVIVSPAERESYQMTPQDEARLASVLPLVFEAGETHVYAAP